MPFPLHLKRSLRGIDRRGTVVLQLDGEVQHEECGLRPGTISAPTPLAMQVASAFTSSRASFRVSLEGDVCRAQVHVDPSPV